jgi:hypothetical protein
MNSLVNCGKTQEQQHNQIFNITGFETYYSTFVAYTNHGSNDLIIKFGDPKTISGKSNVVGLCQMGSQTTPIVTIDQTFWNNTTEDLKQELIDHELGHCILNRQHRNDLLPNGNPSSIMNAYLFDPNVIKSNNNYYQNELVND